MGAAAPSAIQRVSHAQYTFHQLHRYGRHEPAGAAAGAGAGAVSVAVGAAAAVPSAAGFSSGFAVPVAAARSAGFFLKMALNLDLRLSRACGAEMRG